jgi:transcriptional regulator with PAS, ATPase and Fis domain
VLSTPISWDGEVRGLLHLDFGHERTLCTDKELAFLAIVARDLGLYIEKGLNYRQLEKSRDSLQQRFDAQKCIIGISEKTRSMLKAVEKLAATDATVLIAGETGTGKDLVAEVLHANSRRGSSPFIQVNCAAIPDNLLESEMFGVIANYPGLHNREALKGKFELAQGGTVFLNEIGELPQRLQAKLLDALEKKVIWPLGRNQPLAVDVRIIAATNRDLREEIKKGTFREDLYERLKVFSLHLSPLRERREDVPLLAGYFLHCLRKEYGKKISRFTGQCIEFLSSREWPGNVRELKHAIERAIIWTESAVITQDLFDTTDDVPTSLKSLEEVAKQHIVRVLALSGDNREKAARILGISKQTLYNKAREYGLPGFEKG